MRGVINQRLFRHDGKLSFEIADIGRTSDLLAGVGRAVRSFASMRLLDTRFNRHGLQYSNRDDTAFRGQWPVDPGAVAQGRGSGKAPG